MAEALARCGVQADPQIARLLAGEPTRLYRAGLTATWVATLYAGLAEAAPWRLAAAHRRWREGRQALGLAARRPIPLFGLGGMTQARKPKVALDATADGPLLRLYYTGGSAVLPRSLWTLPADLVPHFHGWPVPPPSGTSVVTGAGATLSLRFPRRHSPGWRGIFRCAARN
jgi:hypothetical protein